MLRPKVREFCIQTEITIEELTNREFIGNLKTEKWDVVIKQATASLIIGGNYQMLPIYQEEYITDGVRLSFMIKVVDRMEFEQVNDEF